MLLHIKEWMAQRSMTQQDLADSIGCNRNTIGNIINGKTFPGEERIKDIASVLDVAVWQLFLDPDADLPYTSQNDWELHCPHCNRPIAIHTRKL